MPPSTEPVAAAIFQAASTLALLAWVALALSPARARWSASVRRVTGRIVPAALAVVYVALFVREGMGDGGYDSLDAVRRLLANPMLLTAGWLHYLAFDLFVGTWIAERAAALGIPHLLVLPLLALCFLFGPAGLLGYALVKIVWTRMRPRPALA